ncbi:hypothetical protein [Longitalea luteola]|uniref:hypothetical protein n=1 Tax=Longitalea luteola TaxID=2812563 RepID=UPI001A95DA9D|nr:hypothetical protein [Longitalea luteola]
MKNRNRKLLVLSTAFALALSIGVTSCKKDKDDNGAASQLSATVGGTAFQPKFVAAIGYSDEIIISGWQLAANDTTYLDLAIPDTVTVNSVLDFDDADVDYYAAKGSMNYTSWASKSHGTVSITSFDKTSKKISGKFSGVLYQWGSTTDSVVVKDGQFNTSYQTF